MCKQISQFQSVGNALGYFIHANPARQKFTNIIEMDSFSTERYAEFDPNNPQLKWARICLAVQEVMQDLPSAERMAFELHYLRKAPDRWGKQKIAKEAGVKKSFFYKTYNKLEDVFVRRGIIPRLRE